MGRDHSHALCPPFAPHCARSLARRREALSIAGGAGCCRLGVRCGARRDWLCGLRCHGSIPACRACARGGRGAEWQRRQHGGPRSRARRARLLPCRHQRPLPRRRRGSARGGRRQSTARRARELPTRAQRVEPARRRRRDGLLLVAHRRAADAVPALEAGCRAGRHAVGERGPEWLSSGSNGSHAGSEDVRVSEHLRGRGRRAVRGARRVRHLRRCASAAQLRACARLRDRGRLGASHADGNVRQRRHRHERHAPRRLVGHGCSAEGMDDRHMERRHRAKPGPARRVEQSGRHHVEIGEVWADPPAAPRRRCRGGIESRRAGRRQWLERGNHAIEAELASDG